MQRGAVALLGASVAVACHAPAPAATPEPPDVTAVAGPPRFDESDDTVLGHRSWEEYVHDAAELRNHRIVLLTAPHPAASPGARYGINLISADRNVSWVLDGDPDHGYWLAIDENGNGVLSDDPVHQLARGPADWRVEVATPPRVAGRPPLRTIVAFDGKMVRSYEMVIRTGQLRIDGRPLPFTIRCPLADCSNPRAVQLGFDLDGDGAVDLRPGSYERYQLDDRTVVAFGRSYDCALAPDGSRLTLRRSTVAHAPRPTLRTGSPAPAFEARDDHAQFSLAAARGHVVLLDFFSQGCHFCIEDLPWLAAVHGRFAGAGLVLVTIAAGAPPPGEPPWPVVVERDPGPVATLYRIAAEPSYFVIDRDGTIACAHCRHEAANRALAQLLADHPR